MTVKVSSSFPASFWARNKSGRWPKKKLSANKQKYYILLSNIIYYGHTLINLKQGGYSFGSPMVKSWTAVHVGIQADLSLRYSQLFTIS